MVEDKNQPCVFTPEQREAIMRALDDPEKLKAVIAILKDAGQLRELRGPSN